MGISNSNYVHSIEKHNCNVGPLNHFTIKFSKSLGWFVVVVACYLLYIVFQENLWMVNCINIHFIIHIRTVYFKRIYTYGHGHGRIYDVAKINVLYRNIQLHICIRYGQGLANLFSMFLPRSKLDGCEEKILADKYLLVRG